MGFTLLPRIVFYILIIISRNICHFWKRDPCFCEHASPRFARSLAKILCDSRFSELSFVESIPKDSRRALNSATLPATVNRTTSEGFGLCHRGKTRKRPSSVVPSWRQKRSTPALWNAFGRTSLAPNACIWKEPHERQTKTVRTQCIWFVTIYLLLLLVRVIERHNGG